MMDVMHIKTFKASLLSENTIVFNSVFEAGRVNFHEYI